MRQRIPPAPSAAAVAAFVSACDAAFEEACSVQAPRSRTARIAGRVVTISIASAEVADRYRPALARVTEEGPPTEPASLTIRAWDTASTGVDRPPLPWDHENLLHRSRVRGHTTGLVRATFQRPEEHLHLYDARRAAGFMHAPAATAVPPWTDRAPFRPLIGWWATDLGMAMMHASCVADDNGAALVAGSSGSGKSTTAMTCVLAGFRFLCDDACVVEVDAAAGPLVHAAYGRAKLVPEAAGRLGIASVADGQDLISDPAHFATTAPARVLLLPEVVGGTASRVEPLARTEVMRTLVPASIREGGGLGGRALQQLTRVVESLPCARLRLGTDPDGVVAAVSQAIEQARP